MVENNFNFQAASKSHMRIHMKPSQQRQKLPKARKERVEGHTGGGSHKNLSYKRNSQLQVLKISARSSEDNIRQGQIKVSPQTGTPLARVCKPSQWPRLFKMALSKERSNDKSALTARPIRL